MFGYGGMTRIKPPKLQRSRRATALHLAISVTPSAAGETTFTWNAHAEVG